MSDKISKKDSEKTTNEKPVSLAGAPFKDVLGALLKTPKPKENDSNKSGKHNNKSK